MEWYVVQDPLSTISSKKPLKMRSEMHFNCRIFGTSLKKQFFSPPGSKSKIVLMRVRSFVVHIRLCRSISDGPHVLFFCFLQREKKSCLRKLINDVQKKIWKRNKWTSACQARINLVPKKNLLVNLKSFYLRCW